MNEPLPPEPISVRRLRAFLARMVPLLPRAGRGLVTARLDRLPHHGIRRFQEPGALESLRSAKMSEEESHRPVAPMPTAAAPPPAKRSDRSLADRFFRSLQGRDPAPPKPSAPSADKPAPTHQETAAVLARRLDQESSPRLPPAGLHHFLAARLGLHVPSVRVHVGPAADRLAVAHGADAVSFAERIVFRHRRYEPQTVAGAALFGHELTHVAARARGVDSSAAATAREEKSALENEHRLHRELAPPALRPAQPPNAPAASGPLPSASVAPAAASVPVVRAAAIERPLPAAALPDRLPAGQVKQLKEEIYRELLDRIRTDFERGS
jgi:hypothetical protein